MNQNLGTQASGLKRRRRSELPYPISYSRLSLVVLGYGVGLASVSRHKRRQFGCSALGFGLRWDAGWLGGQLTGPFPALLCDLGDFGKKR